MKILVAIFSFVIGTLASSVAPISPIVSLLPIIIGIFILIAEKIWKGEVIKEVMYVSLIFIFLGLGIFRYDIKDFHLSDPVLLGHVNSLMVFRGVVVEEPERRDVDTRIVVDTGRDKILVSTDMYSHVEYGDEVEVTGKLEAPSVINPSTSSGQVSSDRSFDYGKYLSKDDIYFTASFAKVNVISEGNGNMARAYMLKVKSLLVERMKAILPEPESSLLAGLIVSGKDALPKSIVDEFRRAGVVHIVVLSGYNITIVAEFLRKIFAFLSLRFASIASVVGIILFVLMTGGSSTVIRASIMASIAIGGKVFGRRYSASRALIIAGFIMVVINPKILVFDPSFQLSFLATLALIYAGPIVERYLERIPEKWGIRSMLSTTIATQVVVLPYLLYNMGNFSIVSLFSNILILLFVPLTMLVGFVATMLAFISRYIALPFSFVSHILLAWILGVAHVLGNFKYAFINITTFPLWLTILLYIALILIFLHLRKKGKSLAPRV